MARLRVARATPAASAGRARARQVFAGSLVSVAGLVGRPVQDTEGRFLGRLDDVVVRTEPGYPRVAGFVVRIGQRRSWLHAEDVQGLDQSALSLLGTRFDLTDVTRRPGEVQLKGDILDHQLLDIDGVRVVRASDLYLARISTWWHLVGVDVSWLTFLRRSLPGVRGRRPSPAQVVDWTSVQPFDVTTGRVHLTATHAGLKRLRAAELADLLEDLGRAERRALLETLDTDTAADALEEMQPEELAGLLRDAPAEQAAKLLAEMERDEAAEALRDLDEPERAEILTSMPSEAADELRRLLAYEEDTTGGVMTTEVVAVHEDETVGAAIAALRGADGFPVFPTGVAVVDAHGRLVDEVSATELLGEPLERIVGELVGPPFPVTLSPDADLDELVEVITDNRGMSVIVVDDEHRPIGRVQADDVIDALVSHPRWPWQQRWKGSVS